MRGLGRQETEHYSDTIELREDTMPDRSAKWDLRILAGLSFSIFLYQMFASSLSSYGYFIDELYYIACSKHLAFGYVDHPPLSIMILALSRWFLGDSMSAIRFLPALAGATNVFVTGLIVRRFGGSRLAIVIAALATIIVPVYLLMGSFYSMNAFEPLIWTSILYFVVRLVQEDDKKCWLAIGILMGIGMEMKHTMALYGIALILGMLVTNGRHFLRNKWFLWGVLGCFVLLLPNLIWQYLHGFPSLEFYKNAMANKNILRSPLNVVLDQVLYTNPATVPVWIAGFLYFFFSREGKRYLFLAWAYLLLLAVMVVSGSSRPDRIAAMYPVLFAAGAVAIEKIRRRSMQRYMTVSMVVVLAAGGVILAPVFTPVLPPALLRQYISALGLSFDIETGKRNEPLPQWLADRLGWRELAADVGVVYHTLSAEEQQNSIIVSTNYGEAGALELYGREFGLPRVFATHNSYHLWGPPPDSVRTYIGVFVNRRDLQGRFESVVEAGIHICEDCTRPQRRIPIYVARGPRFSISAEWANFKIYD